MSHWVDVGKEKGEMDDRNRIERTRRGRTRVTGRGGEKGRRKAKAVAPG